jgi:hypothetical protein
MVVNAGGGRRSGTNSWLINDSSTGFADCVIQRTLTPADAKIVIAFAIRFDRWADLTIRPFFAIGDGTVWHLGMQQLADGTLEFYRGRNLGESTGGTLIANSGFAPVLATYYHFSIETTIDDSAGTLSFKVNGIEKLNAGAGLTGIDTRNGGTAAWTRFAWTNNRNTSGGGRGTPRIQWCDLVVNDGSGGSHDTHPGDCGVYVALPDGNGGVRDFAPSTGTDDFAVVDEVPPNDGTDYLESTAVDDRVTMEFPALAIPAGLVKSLTFRHRLSLAAAGTGQAVGVMRKGGVNYDGAVTLAPTLGYDYFDDRRIVDPDTGIPFTISDVDAIEGGLKRSL